jgi:ABC-type uncharacterized transport system permease subunit
MSLVNLGLFFYVAAMAFALMYGGVRKEGLFWISFALAAAGFIAQTLFLAYGWGTAGYPPAANLNELFRVAAWAILALYFALYPVTRSRILVFFLMPFVTLVYFGGCFIVPDPPVQAKPYYFTAWFTVHILLLVFGMAFFFLSFLYAAIFIMQDHSLRQRHGPSPLPIASLEEAERWSSRLLLCGYPLFTLGIFSSALYGILHGGKSNYRPGLIEGASILAWIVLGAAIYGWFSARVHPRRRAWLVVGGAAFSVLVILGIVWH